MRCLPGARRESAKGRRLTFLWVDDSFHVALTMVVAGSEHWTEVVAAGIEEGMGAQEGSEMKRRAAFLWPWLSRSWRVEEHAHLSAFLNLVTAPLKLHVVGVAFTGPLCSWILCGSGRVLGALLCLCLLQKWHFIISQTEYIKMWRLLMILYIQTPFWTLVSSGNINICVVISR